jgi:hypothetical protein
VCKGLVARQLHVNLSRGAPSLRYAGCRGSSREEILLQPLSARLGKTDGLLCVRSFESARAVPAEGAKVLRPVVMRLLTHAFIQAPAGETKDRLKELIVLADKASGLSCEVVRS